MLTIVAAVFIAAVTGCDSSSEASTAAAGEASQRDNAGAKTVYPTGSRPSGPQIVGTLLDGSTFDTSTLTGKATLINFWASDCAPCRAEADDLQAVYDASRDDGVVFLGVNVRDSQDAATAFVRASGIGYPSLFDPAGKVGLQFKDVPLTFIPATVILDRHGDVAAVFHTALVRTELQPLVSRLAAESV